MFNWLIFSIWWKLTMLKIDCNFMFKVLNSLWTSSFSTRFICLLDYISIFLFFHAGLNLWRLGDIFEKSTGSKTQSLIRSYRVNILCAYDKEDDHLILNWGGGGVGLAFFWQIYWFLFRILRWLRCRYRKYLQNKKTPTNTQTLGGDGLGPTGKCLNLFSKTESNPCIWWWSVSFPTDLGLKTNVIP